MHRLARSLLTGLVVLGLTGCGPEGFGGPGDVPSISGRPTAAETASPATSDPGATKPTLSPPVDPTEPSVPEPADPRAPSEPPRTTPANPPEATGRLAVGDTGPRVRALQEQLTELGYWLGVSDGTFGNGTAHAVVALQKAAGLSRDGIVGPATREALARGVRPEPRSTDGRVIEIDRDRQLLLVVDNGRLVQVFDSSTGGAATPTPLGRFRVTREIDGYRTAPLGVLYRPKYFHGGIAIHGYPSVPSQPASHGCVRVTNAAMDWIWANDVAVLGTPVWVR